METRQLKNITILILLLLNLFLLSLLLHFRLQKASSGRRLAEQLLTLYENSAVALPEEEALLNAAAPVSLSLNRDLHHEAEIAAFLLGEETEGEAQGGGIYTYTGSHGTVQFRSNGAFDYTPKGQRINAPLDFCQEFCDRFGYVEAEEITLSGENGSFSALRSVEGVPVYNASLSFLFEDGLLLSVSGSCLSPAGSAPLSGSRFTVADALVKFLDYRNASGVVCSAVTGVKPVYELQATAAQPMGLAAKWQVSTDTYLYYVDCATGEISRP